PDNVRAFISQHHGTRLVTYFYRKAAQSGGEVDPAPYRYAGPRPQAREAAIVMLAASCEAVVRARQGAGKDGVEADADAVFADRRARQWEGNYGVEPAVDAVFAERLAEGQLADCDITLRALQDVASSFKATLRAVYHPRLPYPDPTPEELAGLARGESVPGFG